jgi:uncharacterized protein (TIRG00374 family)
VRRGRRWARAITSVVLTAAVVEYAVLPQLVRGRAELDRLSGISPWLIGLALLLEAASLSSYTWLTQATVPVRHRLGWLTQLAMDLTGFAASHVLPGGGTTATAIRYRLMTARGVPRPDVISTTAVEATFSYLGLLLTYCVGVGLALPQLNDHPAYVITAAVGLVLIGASGLGSSFLARSRPGTHVARIEPLRSPRLQRWARQWRHLVADIRAFLSDHERRNVALLFALGNWVLDAACLWLCLAALGEVVVPGLLLTAYGAANLAGLLPVTPGGLGVIEGVLMPALVAFGVAGGVAVLGVLAWRVLQFWLPIPVGGIAYIGLRISDLRAGRDLSRPVT